MTIYLKELLDCLEKRHGAVSAREMTEALLGLGLIDHTLCKAMAVRERFYDLIGQGYRKIDAMWMTSEKFCCSYEYVRKCVYYYTDINMPAAMSEIVETETGGPHLI